jgi:hypothetical protein
MSTVSLASALKSYGSLALTPMSLSEPMSMTPASRSSKRRPSTNIEYGPSICLALHILAFALHVVLLFLWRYNGLQRFSFELGKPSETASTVITVLLQSMATVGASFEMIDCTIN